MQRFIISCSIAKQFRLIAFLIASWTMLSQSLKLDGDLDDKMKIIFCSVTSKNDETLHAKTNELPYSHVDFEMSFPNSKSDRNLELKSNQIKFNPRFEILNLWRGINSNVWTSSSGLNDQKNYLLKYDPITNSFKLIDRLTSINNYIVNRFTPSMVI